LEPHEPHIFEPAGSQYEQPIFSPEQPLEPSTLEDIVINQHQEQRPHVDMSEVHQQSDQYSNEPPPLFSHQDEVSDQPAEPYEPPSYVEDSEPAEELPAEEFKKDQPELQQHYEQPPEAQQEHKESAHETLRESEGLHEKKSFMQAAGGFSAAFFKKIGAVFHGF